MQTIQQSFSSLARQSNPSWIARWLALMLLAGTISTAHSAPPSLESLSPPVASRGTIVELRAAGSFLSNCDRVLLLRDGIEPLAVHADGDEAAILQLKIDEHCPLGFHPVRLHSPNGISELRLVCVSPFPVTFMAAGEEPPAVQTNRTLVTAISGDQVHRYRILAKQGDFVSAEVVAVRLGVQLLDMEMTVFHPDGTVACQVDDTPLLNQDPCFSLRAEQSGEYRIEVRSVGTNADARSPYAIHLGSFPRPATIFPAAGASGSHLEICLYGTDPLSDPLERLGLTLPTVMDASEVAVELVRHTADGPPVLCPSPITMRAVPFPTWSSDDSATELPVAPVAFHGGIMRDGQSDDHTIKIPEDGPWVAEVFAERLGSRLDACLEVYDLESERCIARGDDFNSHDARVVFNGLAERTYRVRICDKRSQASPWHSYRIEIQRLRPTLMSFLPRRDKLSQNGQTLSVPRDNRSLAIMAMQRNRIVGSAGLDWQGLPPHVQVQAPTWDGDAFALPVVLDATSKAVVQGAWVQPIPRTDSYRGSFTQVVDLVRGPADAIYCESVSDRLGIAITPSVPYRVDLIPPTQPLPIGGTLDLRIRVHRDPGFRQPFEVSIPILPEFVDAPAKVRIESDQNEGVITLRSFERARPDRWPLVVEACVAPLRAQEPKGAPGAIDIAPSASSPLDSPAVCSELNWLEIQPCPASAVVEAMAAEQGQDIALETTFQGDIEMTHPWTAVLEGLPNRVTAEPLSVEPGERSLRFLIRISDDAPLGTFDSLQIRLSGKLKEQWLTYCIATRTRLVIARPGEAHRDELGRPLSRLDALRRARTRQP